MESETSDYRAEIRAPIYPTEDYKILVSCLSKLFPEADWDIQDDMVIGDTRSLYRFSEILRDLKIRDTARMHMMAHVSSDTCEFVLSKQASCSRRVNFFQGKQPLGGITVKIPSERIKGVIEELTCTEVSR